MFSKASPTRVIYSKTQPPLSNLLAKNISVSLSMESSRDTLSVQTLSRNVTEMGRQKWDQKTSTSKSIFVPSVWNIQEERELAEGKNSHCQKNFFFHPIW